MDINHVTNPSSSVSRQPGYEVFLSFRGPDTRMHFADFLYYMLKNAGIHVFRDEEGLERGKEILPQLIWKIEQSKISIAVISKGYASSKSCLEELKQMVECMDKKNHIIIPIFYYVDPSDVRNCSGPFERVFDEHKKRGRDGRFVNHWMPALRRIGNLKGHHLHEKSGKYHTEVIKQIVQQVVRMLKKNDQIVPKQLVGVDPHVQEIMAKLKVDYHNGQAFKIGDTCEKLLIYGIPGVGKTVLAKCVYNQLHHLYDACSFLEKIQEEIGGPGILSVQNRLISHLHKGDYQKFDHPDPALTHIQSSFLNMKVLLLLDDVKDGEQLSALVGELDWFGRGSTVIVTSQGDDVLGKLKGAETFVLRMMEQDNALTLFCKHAFGTDCPPEKFKQLATKIVATTDGLPLALQKVGEYLSKQREKKAWEEKLTALKEAPDESVQAAFEKSYATLNDKAKQIFLDIACFFDGMDQRIPYYMWNDFRFYPCTSISSLQAKSLVEIREDQELCMHGILKTLGREIVKNESKDEPCWRSRLWNPEEALAVLMGRKCTKKVEALGLMFADGSERNISLECEKFDGLQKLRFLKLDRTDIRGDFTDRLSSLRWLDWQSCPEILDVQSLNLNLQNLVILDLSGSQVGRDWRGWDLLKQARRLKVLKLTGCVQLTATPEFPDQMELERLILEGCSNLKVNDQSFGNLTKLVSLNMKGCSLLHECGFLNLAPMTCLKELDLSNIAIQELPPSVKDLKKMKVLRMRGTSIREFPEAILNLKKLKEIDFSLCRSLEGKIPEDVGRLSSLVILKLSDTQISGLPRSMSSLSRLGELHILRCPNLQSLPDLPPSIKVFGDQVN